LRWAIAAALALGVAASGVVMLVGADEVAIVYRFGAVDRTVGSGLAFRLPGPIERDQRIGVSELRRVETGSMRLLTGDTNLLVMNLTVQYSVSDPVAFALRLLNPEVVIAAAVRATATHSVSRSEVDVLLTTGRAALQREVADRTQLTLDALEAGVRIHAVEVSELVPPAAVVDAFNDVSSARGDKETMVLGAHAYASKVLPDTRGRSVRRLEEARAYSSRLNAVSAAATTKFRAVHSGYRTSSEAISGTLRTQAWRKIAQSAEFVVAPPGADIVLPFSESGR
jgi:membrane protease subunit HflK